MTPVSSVRAGAMLSALAMTLFTGCTSDLNRAIARENQAKTEEFLAANPNLEMRDHHGATALVNACAFGKLPLIQRLVDRGADVNASDEDGNTPLHKLATRQFLSADAVRLLLAHGAKVDAANHHGLTPLHAACRRGASEAQADDMTELIGLLLKAGADANRRTIYGELPLHLAGRLGLPPQSIDLLVAATKEPSATDDDGYNAFSEAIRGGRHDAAVALAKHSVLPQDLRRQPLRAFGLIDPNLLFQGRVDEACGDVARDAGDPAAAAQRYGSGMAEYATVVAQYERVVGNYTASLKKAKDDRLATWQTMILLNALGAASAAATGVGVFVYPTNLSNHIDEFEAELRRDRDDLEGIREEKVRVDRKASEFPLPAKPASTPPQPTSSL
jgi:hypothetical protein